MNRSNAFELLLYDSEALKFFFNPQTGKNLTPRLTRSFRKSDLESQKFFSLIDLK